jgi:hypothetical protein
MTPGSSLIAALKNVAAIAFCSGQDPEDSPFQLEPLIAGVPNLRARIFDQEYVAQP